DCRARPCARIPHPVAPPRGGTCSDGARSRRGGRGCTQVGCAAQAGSAVMPWTVILLFVLKAFFVVMFAMNLAVVLTWADRRQGSMIQDRVGPNRAVVWIPRPIAQALALFLAAPVA